jgi:diaminopimelate epimerase
MRASFCKAHVLGNTYVVLLEPRGYRLTAQRVIRICASPGGMEAHGVVAAGERDPFTVRVYNADGSRAETSGNGLRIYGWWMLAQGLRPLEKEFVLSSKGRRYPVSASAPRPGLVGVRLGRPYVTQLPGTWWRAFSDLREARYVRVGNPHFSFETSGDVGQFPLGELAAIGERSGGLPGGANVEVYVPATHAELRARIWERGVGETPSSGSGSSAVAAAAWDTGIRGCRLCVQMPGGSMVVSRTPDACLWSWGVVEEICRGELVLP